MMFLKNTRYNIQKNASFSIENEFDKMYKELLFYNVRLEKNKDNIISYRLYYNIICKLLLEISNKFQDYITDDDFVELVLYTLNL